jgi:hypothetical protein
MTVQKFIILACGWIVAITGLLLTPLPIPLPFPVGAMLFLVGCTILTTHSKMCRRLLQRIRHKSHRLSHGLEFFSRRAPRHVKHMVVKTRPHAVHRHERMRARRDET